MNGLLIYLCLLTSVFYFSEGKPCPEKTRRHKTRCDAYYKCRDLPSNSHVWIPIKCKEGLVYEHSVGSCVLPGEDWECLTAGEMNSTTNQLSGSKDADIIIVNNEDESGLLLKESAHAHTDDNSVQIVLDASLNSDERSEPVHESSEYDTSASNQFDSSGDGELVDLEAQQHKQQQPQNREGALNVTHTGSVMELDTSAHSDEQLSTSRPGPIDPSLKAHLQRLSQLIDGLQQTYQKTDKPQMEMRPDQLNAFLAHFDLKNRYDMFNPIGSHNELAITTTTSTTTTPKPMEDSGSTLSLPPATLPEPTLNKTQLQEHLTKQRLKPETKLLLSSAQPFSSYGQGYANSQIVVNRPEGSVTFTLPQYGGGSDQPQRYGSSASGQSQSHEYLDHEPKVSEETLKTVLELSKQMIAAQNLPKVIQNPGYNGGYYGPPILQPVILTTNSNPYQPYYTMQSYESPSPPRTPYMHHKRPNGYNKKQPSTTIIHNNVIPVHLSSTSSGEREVLDAYGNSLGVYPNKKQQQNEHNNNNNNNHNNNNNYFDKFMTTMTTVRPSTGVSVTTMSSQYTGQYAAPYASEFTQTTPRPFEQQPSPATVSAYYTPSPHLDESNVHQVFNSESYPTSMSMNLPRPMNSQNLFPMQLQPDQVKIRPNAQKIESVEMESDDAISLGYGNQHQQHQQQQQQQQQAYSQQQSYAQPQPQPYAQQHVLTYSSGAGNGGGGGGGSAELLSMTQQLAPRPYMGQSMGYGQAQSAANEPNRPDYSPAGYMSANSLPPGMGSVYNEPSGNMASVYGSSLATAAGGAGGGAGTNSIQIIPGKSKYANSMGQLVNFNGNFISLEMFQKSILPLMTQSPSALSDLGKVEVITCQAGVRQPNQTDCTRYFVCSKKDGKVLSYSCPPYTGFNKQTRICDAVTYAQCGNVPALQGYTIEENKRLQLEALKMLAEAKRRQEAALKSQNLANLLQQYGSMAEAGAPAGSMEHSLLDTYMLGLPELSTTTTPRPQPASATPSPLSSASSSSSSGGGSGGGSGSSSGSVKKRKYYCREGDKIPDQTSISSYFVCYKNAQGQMKGHKMTCSKGLLFCPRTLMCTLASKCSG